MSYEASFHTPESQPPPEWADLTQQARLLTEQSKAEPVGEADATVSWTDGDSAIHTLSRFDDVYVLNSRDAEAAPLINVAFDDYGPEGYAFVDEGDDRAARTRLADVLQGGPGTERYGERTAQAMTNVWDATWGIVTGRYGADTGDLMPDTIDDERVVPVNGSVEIADRTLDEVWRDDSERTVTRVEITGPHEQGFTPMLSTYVEHYDRGALRRMEVSQVTLHGDGTLEMRDSRTETTAYSQEPHIIQHMAHRLEEMMKHVQSGRNTIN